MQQPVDGFASPIVVTELLSPQSVGRPPQRRPGGQHANTTDSAVTITIDVAATGLSTLLIERVTAAINPTVTATSASRSQWPAVGLGRSAGTTR